MRALSNLLLLAVLYAASCVANKNFLTPQHWQESLASGDGEVLQKTNPLLALHKDLVNIPSVTGNEHDVGKYLVSYLEKHDFTVETQTVGKKHDGRFNVLAYPGKRRDTKILVTSHMDTVPPFIPYSTHEHDSSIFGRGTADAKGSVAAQITAVRDLLFHNRISPGDVALLFVVGEETGGDGMRTANELNLTWSSVIFGEPTENKLASGHKGNLAFKMKAHGKAAHSGYPWLGTNANDLLIPALAALQDLEKKLPKSRKYGVTTLNIGKISGGVAANVIPEYAEAEASVRIAAETPAVIKAMIMDAIKKTGNPLDLEFTSAGYGPVEIDHNIHGFDSITVNYGTDIPNLEGNHKRYLYGPGSILVAHAKDEHVSVKALERAVEDYKKIIIATLRSVETQNQDTVDVG